MRSKSFLMLMGLVAFTSGCANQNSSFGKALSISGLRSSDQLSMTVSQSFPSTGAGVLIPKETCLGFFVSISGAHNAFTASLSTSGNAKLYSDSSCSSSISQLSFPSSSSQEAFYITDSAAETVSVTASSSYGSTSFEAQFTSSQTQASPLPDLVVTSISVSPTTPVVGQAVTFTAVVKNQGNAATPPGVTVGVAFDIDGVEVTWSGGNSNSLLAGASETLVADGGPSGSSTWTATAGIHTLEANVNDVKRFTESNFNNNTLSETLSIQGGPTPPPSTLVSIASIQILNAANNQVVQTLTNGSVINMATMPASISIIVNTSGSASKVVINDGQTVTLNSAPYLLCGPSTSTPCALAVTSSLTFSVQAYNSAGIGGPVDSITISIVNQSATPTPSPSSAPTSTPTPIPSGKSVTAASCSESAVQSAISAAAPGDTVFIPAGTCTWTTPLSVTVNGSLSIIGAGSQTTTGGGDATTLIDNVNHSSTDYMISVDTGATTNSFRWSAITIKANGSSTISNNGVFVVGGASQSVRIDHAHWSQNDQLELNTSGQIAGVVDHVIFDLYELGARSTASGYSSTSPGNGDGNGDGSWADAATPGGSANIMYFENNVFNNTNTGEATPANDCISGGRFVMRYNTFNAGAALQTHPTGHDRGNDRGCRYMEIYGNSFADGATGLSNPEYNAMFWSAGTGYMWGNSLNQYRYGITFHNMRVNNNTYSQVAQPNGWGFCGTAQTGTGSSWDQNSSSQTGYACLDQPGTGQSDLLSGDFPNKCDETTGCKTFAGTWPNQVKAPIYEWSDTWTGTPGYPGSFTNIVDPGITQNQDFYTWCSANSPTGCTSFNGTQGVGSGTLASRPSTCTKGVAYWATDQGSWNKSGNGGQGQLYTCSATNTWTASYTPYTYPHPLDR